MRQPLGSVLAPVESVTLGTRFGARPAASAMARARTRVEQKTSAKRFIGTPLSTSRGMRRPADLRMVATECYQGIATALHSDASAGNHSGTTRQYVGDSDALRVPDYRHNAFFGPSFSVSSTRPSTT